MVYCGPPSKGCSSCRDRKIRCDLKESSCGQCEKRQQTCPGYRNMVDLMFRDESSHVIKKAQAKQQRRRTAAAATTDSGRSPGGESAASASSSSSTAKSAATPATPTVQPMPLALLTRGAQLNNATSVQHRDGSRTTSRSRGAIKGSPSSTTSKTRSPVRDYSPLSESHTSDWPVAPPITRICSLAPSFRERGTAYFFSRYVTIDENALHQRFDFIYDIWKPGPATCDSQMDAVMASMAAVGLGGLSQLTHSKEIFSSARESYGTALRLVNAALKDPEEAVKDTTMLCVLILGVFEMMAGPGKITMKAWYEHINGAVVLAKLRGTSQLRTNAGIRMFNMLCQSVMIASMQKRAPMPPELISFQSELLSGSGTEAVSRGFSRIALSKPIFMMLQMRHDVHENLINGLDGMLGRLEAIDSEFTCTVGSFPAVNRFKVLHVTRPHRAVFRNHCHVYRSTAVSSIWNLLRVVHILELEFVLTTIQRSFPDVGEAGEGVPAHYLRRYCKAWTDLQSVTDAIVASVPQHFGLLNLTSPYFDTLKPMEASLSLSDSVTLLTTVVKRPPNRVVPSPPSSASSASATPPLPPDDWAESDEYQPTDLNELFFDDGGPTLENPTRARSDGEEAARLMLLASSTNGLVWPLFCVGTSSVCTPLLKAYVVERLNAIYDETGLKQASTLASIVRNRELIKSPWLRLPTRLISTLSMEVAV
ncbi:c6 zinc finger domain containing protein [Grosmannia clavigera kw1407]|uniref:C6 zinc finger domain containing protein n=1 Tax=Grosmannia clavigera (strain kw1407 / UAMH 11150) TaxID=655863 RepID=F0XAC8_GROCL|nr:c6 zinc finger domain containing protein [Grosmannia clavigera kw1407]EFX05235.1 c6 zinc finger domain containing protein [Grosmannia clavigera kw1407]